MNTFEKAIKQGTVSLKNGMLFIPKDPLQDYGKNLTKKENSMKYIDIMDIKQQSKNGRLEFFIKNNNLMCKDTQTQECVIIKENFITE